jgi:urease accessory protein UreF
MADQRNLTLRTPPTWTVHDMCRPMLATRMVREARTRRIMEEERPTGLPKAARVADAVSTARTSPEDSLAHGGAVIAALLTLTMPAVNCTARRLTRTACAAVPPPGAASRLLAIARTLTPARLYGATALTPPYAGKPHACVRGRADLTLCLLGPFSPTDMPPRAMA